MVLADDITNSIGQIILPAGITLGESHRQSLKRFNITTVKIIGEDEDIDSEVLESNRSEVLQRMEWKPRNDQEKDLLEAVTLYIAHNNYEADRENNI